MPRRVHILGAPGSGKTFLASRLAELTGSQLVNLDTVAYSDAHTGEFEQPRSRVDRLVMVSQYSQKSSWVAEGSYFSWCGQSFKHADLIVVLEVPDHVRIANLRTRHVDDNPRFEYLVEQSIMYANLFDQRITGFLEPFSNKIRKFSGVGKAFAFLEKRVRPAS